MKQFFSIAILFLFLYHSFEKVYIVLSFETNRDFIATALCINKDKPDLLCSGKCYLIEQLADQGSDSNQSLPPFMKVFKDFMFTYPKIQVHVSEGDAITNSGKKKFYYQNTFGKEISMNIFHPPRTLV